MSKHTAITLGNASYGFREYNLKDFFEASKKIGISSVEIDAGWLVGEAKNAISLNATPEEIEKVRHLASDAGVKVAALGGVERWWRSKVIRLIINPLK